MLRILRGDTGRRAYGEMGIFENARHRRRGFAAPPRTVAEEANPLAAADRHARVARLPGFFGRRAQHAARC
jgi:hypothetical protein